MERKQILFTDIGKAALTDTVISPVTGNEVLVKTEFSVVSAGTERANLLAEPNTAAHGKFPIAEGYCSVGRVAEVGPDVKTVKPGDRVLCYHGFHASYNKVKENRIYPIYDDAISSEEASLVIIAAMGLGGVRKLNIELGQSGMVIGLGLLGIFSAQFMRLSGANPVIVSDLSAERRQLALELGADYALDPTEEGFLDKVKEITRGSGVRNIVEVTGRSIALNQALDCASYMGRISLLGCTRVSDSSVDYYSQVHRPGVELIGAHNMVRPLTESYPGHWTNRDDCLAILDMLSRGRVSFKKIISEIHKPEDAPSVYERLANDRNFPLGVLFDWRSL